MVAAALGLMVPLLAFGQQNPAAGAESHQVAGRVLRPLAGELVPVRNLWVTLHRLGSDAAGPIDSMRTDARGAYGFHYRASGDEHALYFAAASYGGVAYFTPPRMAGPIVGEAAEIVVFDTTSVPLPLSVRGRHLIVSAAGADQSREIIEVYELANDSSLTLVSPTEQSPPTWIGMLPQHARDARASQGDVPAEAVIFTGREVRVVSPMPPGMKQLAYSYTMPAAAFPLSIELGTGTDVYEVLIEDASGVAHGAQLEEVEPVRVDGRTFRRFLAQDVPSDAVAVIDIPRAVGGWDRRYVAGLMLLIAGTMLFSLSRVLRRTSAAKVS